MIFKNMKFLSSFFFLFPILIYAQDLLDQGSMLPLFVVDTYGTEIPNEPKTEAHLGIIHRPGNTNLLTDPFNVYDGRIGIEIRGNGTIHFDKVSYLFETQLANGDNNNVSLLGFPKENDWVLYGPFIDKSLIRNILTYDLARKMGYYASRVQFCELVINGEYLGVYVFMEKIKRDKDRVNLTKFDDPTMSPSEGGFLFKIDSWWNQTLGWQSATYTVDDQERKWNYHYLYPKVNQITEIQKSYIKDIVDHFENKLFSLQESGNTEVYDLIDVENFADYFIINEFTKNPDAYRLSTFLYKDADAVDGRIKLGPVWDYNFALSNYWGHENVYSGWEYDNSWWEFPHQIPFWWSVLLEDTYFFNVVKGRWAFWRGSVINCDNFTHQIDQLGSVVNAAADRNFTKWPILGQPFVIDWYAGNTYTEELSYLNNWICQRIQWLDQEFDYQDTNIPAPANEDAYTIYPNPASDQLCIYFPDTFPNYPFTIRLFDVNNIPHSEQTLTPSLNQTKINISLPDLMPGLFILELSNQQGSSKWKVIIK